MAVNIKGSIKEDKWLSTVCSGCYGNCAVMVHRVDGVVVQVKGNPEAIKGAQGGG